MKRSGSWRGFGGAAAIVAGATLAAAVLQGHVEPSDLTMLYLLGVVISAIAFGRAPAVAAALLSVALFDFLFVPPHFTFRVSESRFVVTFAVMLVVAVITGTLTAHLREQRERARMREERLASLYRLSQELAVRGSVAEILETAVRRIADLLGTPVAASVSDGHGGAALVAGDSAVVEADPERAAVMSALLHGRPLGFPFGEPAGVTALHIPLVAGTSIGGVVSIGMPGRELGPDSERLDMIRAFCNLVALALERCRLADEARANQAQIETERARSALLSSVSHDLRTPLATITGAASTLRDDGGKIAPEERRELAESISHEAERLNRFVGNLLEMTRVDSGVLRVRKEWHSLEEVVGAALSRLEVPLGTRPLHVSIARELPLIPMDDVLFEQVVRNLVENADKYSPSGSPIELRASVARGALELVVEDRGSGLAEGEEERVFEKFYRGARAGSAPGGGLGLAICRGIMDAHGGTIVAANRPGGGASFTARLPLGGSPPPVEREEDGRNPSAEAR